MAIRNKIRGALGALSLAAGLGCNMLSPEGVAVKQDADGIITEEEEDNIGAMLNSDSTINDFAPFRPFVNDFNVFMGNELASAGFEQRRFSDELHVYMAKDEAEMQERYIGSRPLPHAFYMDINSTIYMPMRRNAAVSYIMLFTHESGHSFRNDAYEFPSEAHEMYFAFRAYSMNKKIGSLFAMYALPVPDASGPDLSRICIPVDEYLVGDFQHYYHFGDLGFLAQANLENGNIEKAFNNILSRPSLYLEESTRETARQYSNLCDASLGEFEKLLAQHGFLNGLLRHMDEKAANEFTEYLRITSIERIQLLKSWSGLAAPDAEIAENLRRMELFLVDYNGNAYFRNVIIPKVSLAYMQEAAEIAGRPANWLSLEDKLRVYGLANKIIGLNKNYPCAPRFYECMGDVEGAMPQHVLGYLFATAFGNELIASGNATHASLIAIPEGFAAKFYPTGNYHYEDTNANVAVYSPYILFFAADLEEKMAGIAASNNDEEEFVQHMCRALEWYRAVVDAGCARIPDAEKKAECESVLDTIAEKTAQRRLDNRRGFYERNCF